MKFFTLYLGYFFKITFRRFPGTQRCAGGKMCDAALLGIENSYVFQAEFWRSVHMNAHRNIVGIINNGIDIRGLFN